MTLFTALEVECLSTIFVSNTISLYFALTPNLGVDRTATLDLGTS
ncbi:hypothetical protein [Natranaerobius trueperi]|nr:hypothetical protein [Natranaerobius trueperi]